MDQAIIHTELNSFTVNKMLSPDGLETWVNCYGTGTVYTDTGIKIGYYLSSNDGETFAVGTIPGSISDEDMNLIGTLP